MLFLPAIPGNPYLRSALWMPWEARKSLVQRRRRLSSRCLDQKNTISAGNSLSVAPASCEALQGSDPGKDYGPLFR